MNCPKCGRPARQGTDVITNRSVSLCLSCGWTNAPKQKREREGESTRARALASPSFSSPSRTTESLLSEQLVALGLDAPQAEYQFEPSRKWRFDLAWPTYLIAIEIEGAVHRLKNRFKSDLEKYRCAVKAGWRILRYSPAEVRSGFAAQDFQHYFEREIKDKDTYHGR